MLIFFIKNFFSAYFAPRLKSDVRNNTNSLSKTVFSVSDTNPLSKTLFSVKPLFKRFQRFEKSLYGLKRPIFESDLL